MIRRLRRSRIFGTNRRRAVLALVITVLTIFPVYFMVSGALSHPDIFITRLGGQTEGGLVDILFPRPPILQHFQTVLADELFRRYMINSLIVATITTALAILVCTLGAYSLARLRFPGSNSIGRIALLTYTVPSVLLLIPLFKIVVGVGINDSLTSLVLTYTTFAIPFSLWMLRAFFQSLPPELEDAAMVDGAGRLGALFRVILPLSVPGIAATALFAFILAWNEFLFALIFTSSDDVRTLPIGVALTMTREQTAVDWATAMAASTVSSLPIFIIVMLGQRGFVRGLTAGGVKG